MNHTADEEIKKGRILALEVLKTVERCKDSNMTEDEKAYHLSQIEALARDVTCGQYDKDEDVSGLGC